MGAAISDAGRVVKDIFCLVLNDSKGFKKCLLTSSHPDGEAQLLVRPRSLLPTSPGEQGRLGGHLGDAMLLPALACRTG